MSSLPVILLYDWTTRFAAGKEGACSHWEAAKLQAQPHPQWELVPPFSYPLRALRVIVVWYTRAERHRKRWSMIAGSLVNACVRFVPPSLRHQLGCLREAGADGAGNSSSSAALLSRGKKQEVDGEEGTRPSRVSCCLSRAPWLPLAAPSLMVLPLGEQSAGDPWREAERACWSLVRGGEQSDFFPSWGKEVGLGGRLSRSLVESVFLALWVSACLRSYARGCTVAIIVFLFCSS